MPSSSATLPLHTPQPTTPTTMTQPSAHPKHTAVKAAPKLRTERRPERPRRSAQAPLTTSTTSAPPVPPVPPAIQQDLASLGTTTKELAESVRLIQAQQQQLLMESHRIQEQQQQLRQNPPTTTSPTPPSTTPVPATKARPTEPQAPGHTTSSATTAPPIRIPSKSPSPTGTPTPRPRRSRSRRCSHHRLHGDYPQRRLQRPRSPLPRHRSQQSTQRVAEDPHHTVADLQPVDQNHHAVTLHRILLDAAEHLPEAPLSLHRHHVAWTLDLSLHRMLMTPGVTGKTTNPTESDAHHPDDRRPRSPLGPPSHTSATAPLGSVSYRVATGDSDASDPEESFSIAAYEPGDTDIEEMKSAAADPDRVRCVTELGSSHGLDLHRVG